MKKSLLSFGFGLITFGVFAQTVYKNKVDGQVYLKVQPGLLKSILNDNPKNIVISKLGNLSNTLFKFGTTKVSKPFYQADDDAVLPNILLVQFTQIKQVDQLIYDLQRIDGVDYVEKVNLNTVDLTPNDSYYTGGTMN